MGQFETGSPPGQQGSTSTGASTGVAERSTPRGLIPWRPGQSGNPAGGNGTKRRLAKLLRKDADEIYRELMVMVRDREDPDHFPAVKLAFTAIMGRPRSMDDDAIGEEVHRQLRGLMQEAQRARAERAGAGEQAR